MIIQKKNIIFFSIVAAAVLLIAALPDMVFAKSLYVNKDLNANSPISAYDIQAAPTYLVWQQTSNPTRYGGAGLAIDTDSETLFVTFEGSGTLDIVNAKTLALLGQVIAPNATNLSGIVVDQENQKVYAVDRTTDHLYVYSWNATTKTLTNDITTAPYYITLSGIYAPGSHGNGAHGIALDETKELLYVADVTNIVKIFNTSDWSPAGNVTVTSQKVMGIALDSKNGFLYSGNAYPPYGSLGYLVKTDMNTSPVTETFVDIRSLSGGISTDCVVGLAVDPLTSMIYITSGNQGSGGSDRIMVFDSDLNFLHATADIGNPTGIVVPGKEISYNPLSLSKDDWVAEGECVPTSEDITYDICYDNIVNSYDVNNVIIVDDLPNQATFSSATGGGVYDSSTHSVTWDIGTLPAGTTQQCIQLVVQIDMGAAGTTITNTCTIDSDETPPTTQNKSTDICANLPPVANANGPYLGAVNSPISLDGTGSSDPDGDPLSYEWTFGDGSDTETGATIDHTYAAAGIYNVCLTVDDGIFTSTDCTIAVVYDPDAGFVTGGGWIDSPAGAYKGLDGDGIEEPSSLTGKANFGFVSKYKKGADVPTGQTEFQFQVADLNFHSDSYKWLLVTGSDYARFKGTGIINGEGGYKFMLWAGDDEPDTFRIRIWSEDETTSIETDVYDNGFDQEISGGSIVIHAK